jgi:tight adherence protein B
MTLAALVASRSQNGPLEAIRALVWTQLPSAFFKYSGIALMAAGVGAFVWVSSTDPKGATRRMAIAYVGRVDSDLRSMYRPARGAQIAWSQACGALALLATYGFIHSVALPIAAFLALALPPTLIARSLQKRRQHIDDQANGFALALANALKTTASVADALWVTVSVTTGPVKEELETMLKQVRVGSTMEEALLAMSARAQSPALDVLVSALLIGQKTGGDLPRILESTSNSLREIKRLEELTERVTYSAKQSYAISAVMVIGVTWGLSYFMPGFLDPLRDTAKGQLVAAQCTIAFLASAFMAYRFTRTDI